MGFHEHEGIPIQLQKEDSCLVLRQNGQVELYVPKRDPDDEIPADQLLLTAFATLPQRDSQLANQIIEDFKKVLEEHENSTVEWGNA